MTPQDRTTLKQLYSMKWQDNCRKHPNTETRLIATPKPYDIKKTSHLEKAIVDWITLSGYKAERVHVQGRQLTPEKVTYNVITGKRQTIDKAKFIPGTGTNGSADISCTCRDKSGAVMSLRIEVKNQYTNDRIRPNQVKYKQEHEAAGGTYWIVRSITDFVELWNENVKRITNY